MENQRDGLQMKMFFVKYHEMSLFSFMVLHSTDGICQPLRVLGKIVT